MAIKRGLDRQGQDRDSGDKSVQSLVFGLNILDYLAAQKEAIGVTALAAALGTTKNRIYRHLQTLLALKFVSQELHSEKYRAGIKLITLARKVRENFSLLSASRQVLFELRDALGHTVSISMVEDDGIRILSSVSGTSELEISIKPGALLGFHCTAQGKIALAFGEKSLKTQILKSRLDRRTSHTITDVQKLRREIALTEQRGWAVAPNEALFGLNALAAPVFDVTGALGGTLAILDSVQFLQKKPTPNQLQHVLDAAARISESLGFKASQLT